MSKLTKEEIIKLFDEAPEGATHYKPESKDYYESWFRNISNNQYEINLTPCHLI